MRIRILAMVTALAAAPATTMAQVACTSPTEDLYGLGVSVGGVCGQASFDTAQDLIDGLETSQLGDVNVNYDGTQIANMEIFFNSLPITLSFPNAGFTGDGAALQFSIPELGVNETFVGADRDASQDLLEDFLKDSGVIADIMKYQAANSPHSPISGPGGVIPTAVMSDFGEVFNTMPSDQETEAANLIGAGIGLSSLSVDGRDTTITTIPLSYAIRNTIDPRRQLVFSMPITIADSEGAKAYSFSLGVGYRFPINEAWTLTPAVRYGLTGSEDFATVAGVASATLASTYALRFEHFDMAIGNMIGYYTTTKIDAGDYSFDPDIHNTVLRNGVMLSQPVTLGGKRLAFEYSLIDTRYLGTEIYVDNTQELGITVGTNRSALSSRTYIRGGLNLLKGKDTTGISLNIGYWF
ncbi:MAG: hypothetical protein KDH15_00945 [Rhodocyclaceae bacterium]|nr:hypothetical protein [Rhodocyclaceae bacterium]